MSIELKQAAQQALEALLALHADGARAGWHLQPKWEAQMRAASCGINALRAAIQQAEAKTDEPVYQICRADSVSISTAWVNVQKQQYDDAVLYPEYVRRVLYTHPAPGVTDDVARDAERYRWLKAYYHNSEDIGICKWVDEGWSGQWVLEHDPDTSIDAAMLAASPAQKGD